MQVERRDRPSRPLPRAVAAGDHHDRPVEPLHEPRRDDPDHTLVPAFAGEDVGALPLFRFRPLADLRDRLTEDPVLDLLPFAVELLELGGEPRSLVTIFRQQQLERLCGVAEPPGRVDAWCEPEADGAGVDRCRIDARRAHQRLEPGLLRAGERAEPRRRECAILVEQRHDIGDRGQRDQVEVAVDVGSERGEQLVRDARAAQLGERVPRRPRRHDRAVGQRLARPVVVGDDHVEPEPASFSDLVDGGDPAVHGQHERDAVLRQARERLAGHPVAFVEAAGQVPLDVRPELAQARDRECGRADAVDVVVAVHADALPGGDRRADPVARGRAVAEQARVVARRFGGEERTRRLGVAEPAPDEDAGSDPADPERRREGARLTVRAGTDRPAALLHRATTVRRASDGVRFRTCPSC